MKKDLVRLRWERNKQRLLLKIQKELEIKKVRDDKLRKYFESDPRFAILIPFVGKMAVFALPISTKLSGYFALLPSNLDLGAHIERYPLTDYKFVYDSYGHIRTVTLSGRMGQYFDKERMIYVIGLISSIPARYKDSIDENGYVNILSSYIRDHVKDYLSYLDYLIETGIIICDGHYEIGKKSKGYKFAPKYDVPLVRYTYESVREGNESVVPIEEEVYNEDTRTNERNPLLCCPYLSYWYTQNKLVIDRDRASRYAYIVMRNKLAMGYDYWDINRNRWSKSRNDFCKKYPITQYRAIIYNIEALTINDFKAKIDSHVHRLHSVLTNMQKEYRNFLSYDGQSLVAIDIHNSQPYLMCLLFNPLFWQSGSNLPLNIGMLPLNIQSYFSEEHLIEIRDYITSYLNTEALITYIEKASEGVFYEHIRDAANSMNSTTIDRGTAKVMMLVVFFSKNRFYYQRGAELKRLFNFLYPQVYGLIKLIKKYDHAAFACLLQSIESEIILHRCCKRIWEERPYQVPVFTIHDSIATTIDHKDYVRGVMTDELYRSIGIPPRLSEEFWSETVLQANHPDLYAYLG